ncbi:hypothetical protein GCM10018952_59780 [Streptosporangium vulgare]
MLVAFAVPVVLLFPLMAQVVADPGQLLLEAGLHHTLVDPGPGPAGSLSAAQAPAAPACRRSG